MASALAAPASASFAMISIAFVQGGHTDQVAQPPSFRAARVLMQITLTNLLDVMREIRTAIVVSLATMGRRMLYLWK